VEVLLSWTMWRPTVAQNSQHNYSSTGVRCSTTLYSVSLSLSLSLSLARSLGLFVYSRMPPSTCPTWNSVLFNEKNKNFALVCILSFLFKEPDRVFFFEYTLQTGALMVQSCFGASSKRTSCMYCTSGEEHGAPMISTIDIAFSHEGLE